MIDREEWERSRTGNDDELIQVLEAPPNLEVLRIDLYQGNSFSPSWMLSLTQLKDLKLSYFHNCECLPPLGKLPCLESIYLDAFPKLKKLGVEFLGIDDNQISSSAVMLKKLNFSYFDNWVEWVDDHGIDYSSFTIMPCLGNLPHLLFQKITPDQIKGTLLSPSLLIVGCEILRDRCKPTGPDWPTISRFHF